MTDRHEDLRDFLEHRSQCRPDRDEPPEQEILDALLEWLHRGCPPPSMVVTYRRGRDFIGLAAGVVALQPAGAAAQRLGPPTIGVLVVRSPASALPLSEAWFDYTI